MAEQTMPASPGEALPDWPTRILMLIGGLMVALTMTVVSPILPQIESALAHGTDEKLLVKMLIPFAGAAMVVGAPLTGFLVDRMGVRPILIAHGLIFAVAGTAGFYVAEIHVLLATRLLVGLSAAGMATVSMTLINTRLDGVTRARWMGFHIATAMFGALVIYPAIGVLGELGWRFPFLIYGVGFLVTLFALLGLKRTPTRARARDRGGAGQHDRNPLKWFPLWLLPLALMIGSITYLPTVYLAFVARDVGLTSPSTISTLMLADAIIGAVMALLFGWSQRHMSSYSAFIFSFSCTGTGMMIVSFATSFTGIVVGMLVYGFGIGWFMPNLMFSLSRQVSQGQQGRAVGILKAAHHLASPAAVLAVEPIARAFGSAGAMRASAIASFCMVVLFIGLSGWRRRTEMPAQAAV